MKPVRFGKYSLLDRISHGGMAEVFRAKTFGAAGFERTVAIKLLLPTVAMDHEFVTMLIDEAKIAGQLTHANIAQIFDLGKAEGRYYIVQEYVDGRDLRGILRHMKSAEQSLSIAQASHILLKVCEGLEYAHNKRDSSGRLLNLVHRDVSPQNIVISREGEIKLIDFGIAKAEGRATRTLAGLVKGKFAYMSPEQIRGLPVDRRSDVFACGIVLWELLTGKPLFRRKSEFETLKRARSAEIEPPSNLNSDVPPELDVVVLKALARHVEDRYQTAIEFRDGLWEFVRSSGEFYSRNELANWMRQHFQAEPDVGPTAQQHTRMPGPNPHEPIPTPSQSWMTPTPIDALVDSVGPQTPNPDELVSMLDASPTPSELQQLDNSDDDDLEAPTPVESLDDDTTGIDAHSDDSDDDDLEVATIIDPELADKIQANRGAATPDPDPLDRSHSAFLPSGAPARGAEPPTSELDSPAFIENERPEDSAILKSATPSGLREQTHEEQRTVPHLVHPPPAAAPYVSRGGELAAPFDDTGYDPGGTLPPGLRGRVTDRGLGITPDATPPGFSPGPRFAPPQGWAPPGTFPPPHGAPPGSAPFPAMPPRDTYNPGPFGMPGPVIGAPFPDPPGAAQATYRIGRRDPDAHKKTRKLCVASSLAVLVLAGLFSALVGLRTEAPPAPSTPESPTTSETP